MDKNNQSSNQNIIMGPDYGQLIKSQSNSTIIEAFISFLFSKNTKFDFKNLSILMRNLLLMIFIKTILEDSKSYLDQLKFANLNIFRYLYQSFKYSEVKYEFVNIENKWMYGSKHISLSTLKPFLEKKYIYISQPSTYYWNYYGYLIRVIITANKISFSTPNIEVINRYMNEEVIRKNEEILFGGKTVMNRIVVSNMGSIKMDPIQMAYAFPTNNYIQLEECIKHTFTVDSILKTTNIPFCVNFDGDPGTGKTTFGNYIASSGIFNRIIICNLVQASSINLQDLVGNIERQISNTTSKDKKNDDEMEYILLIFDEIDKWLESYIANQIDKLRNESRNKQQSSDEKNNTTTIKSAEKMTKDEEDDKRAHLKNEFLDQLYRLVEGTLLSDARKYVIIFNTNHFEKMFEGVHERFEALRDRFTKYKFEKAGKTQIIAYLKSFVEKIKSYQDSNMDSNDKKIYSSVIQKISDFDDAIYDKIPENIRISYRTLQKILRNAKSDIEQTVNALASDKNIECF